MSKRESISRLRLWPYHLAYSRVFIALCAAAAIRSGFLMQETHAPVVPIQIHSWYWCLLGFAGTWSLYAFLGSTSLNQRARYSFLGVMLLILAGLAMFFPIQWLYPQGVPDPFFLGSVILGTVLLVVLYFFPLIPGKNVPISLRQIPGGKPFAIALVWVLVTILGPTGEWSADSALVRLLLILSLSIPFDVMDLHRDKEQGLFTLPMWIGVGASLALSILIWLAMAVLLAQILHERGMALGPGFLLYAVLGLLALAFVSRRRADLYYYFILDGFILLEWLFWEFNWWS